MAKWTVQVGGKAVVIETLTVDGHPLVRVSDEASGVLCAGSPGDIASLRSILGAAIGVADGGYVLPTDRPLAP